jgi:hypothetical protein
MASAAEIAWAGSYDGYARVAATPQALWRLVAEADEVVRATGSVPSWCLDAISAHPEARLADLPPGRTD